MTKAVERGWLNVCMILIGIGGVIATYMMQDMTFISHWGLSEQFEFVLRKGIRVLLNDLFMLILITAWFRDNLISRLAVFIQLIDGLILLPVYLFLKLHLEGTSEVSMPLLSQLHRVIINPTFMILLVPAIYFQRLAETKRK